MSQDQPTLTYVQNRSECETPTFTREAFETGQIAVWCERGWETEPFYAWCLGAGITPQKNHVGEPTPIPMIGNVEFACYQKTLLPAWNALGESTFGYHAKRGYYTGVDAPCTPVKFSFDMLIGA